MDVVGINRIAKMLAGVGGVLLVFAIICFSSVSPCDGYARGIEGGSSCGSPYAGSTNLPVAIICLLGAASAIGAAIAIRRSLGGPLISPWKHW